MRSQEGWPSASRKKQLKVARLSSLLVVGSHPWTPPTRTNASQGRTPNPATGVAQQLGNLAARNFRRGALGMGRTRGQSLAAVDGYGRMAAVGLHAGRVSLRALSAEDPA